MEKNYDTNVAVKKESNKVVNVVVVVLVVLLVSLSCYIVYSKFILDESNDKGNQNNSVEEKPDDPVEVPDEPEEVPISKELAFELYNMLYDYSNCGCQMYQYYNKDKITVDELSNEEKTRIIVSILRKEVSEADVYGGTVTVTKEQIIETKNRFLGKNTSFDIISKDECQKFNQKENGDYSIEYRCGGSICTPLLMGEFIKTVQIGDMIYLDQRVVFPNFDMDNYDGIPCDIYQDLENTIFLGKTEYKNLSNINSNINLVIDTSIFAEQASVYRFTFRQNSDYYSFVQMEKIK